MVLFLICHALNNWPILTSEQREMRLQWQLSSLFGASCHDQYISRKRLQNLWMLLLLPRRMGPLRRVAITSSQLLTIKHRTPGQGPLPFIVGPSPRLSPWEARPSVSQRLITWSIFIYSPPENLWARFIAPAGLLPARFSFNYFTTDPVYTLSEQRNVEIRPTRLPPGKQRHNQDPMTDKSAVDGELSW